MVSRVFATNIALKVAQCLTMGFRPSLALLPMLLLVGS
jgi:hypothetical protein